VESWALLTSHARVLLAIARDLGMRLRDIAATAGITERNSYAIVTDLTRAGYVASTRMAAATPTRSRPTSRCPGQPATHHRRTARPPYQPARGRGTQLTWTAREGRAPRQPGIGKCRPRPDGR
jgi:hypothetical protein